MPPLNSASARNVSIMPAQIQGEIQSKEWASVFPVCQLSPEDSCRFVQRCLYVSVAHVLESRRLMDNSVFRRKKIDGNIRAWLPNETHPLGLRLAQKLKGACEALKKGYMDELMLVVGESEQKQDEAVEVYRWKVHYDEHKRPSLELGMSELDKSVNRKLARLEFKGAEQVRLATIALIFSIRKVCRDVLGPLPKGVAPSFRMTFTKGTPADYIPSGFYPSDTLYTLHNAQHAILGSVRTGCHRFALICESTAMDDGFRTESIVQDITDTVFNTHVDGNALNSSFFITMDSPEQTSPDNSPEPTVREEAKTERARDDDDEVVQQQTGTGKRGRAVRKDRGDGRHASASPTRRQQAQRKTQAAKRKAPVVEEEATEFEESSADLDVAFKVCCRTHPVNIPSPPRQ